MYLHTFPSPRYLLDLTVPCFRAFLLGRARAKIGLWEVSDLSCTTPPLVYVNRNGNLLPSPRALYGEPILTAPTSRSWPGFEGGAM